MSIERLDRYDEYLIIKAQRDELLAALKTMKRTARLMHTAEQHETVCIEPQHWRALMEIMAKCEAQS